MPGETPGRAQGRPPLWRDAVGAPDGRLTFPDSAARGSMRAGAEHAGRALADHPTGYRRPGSPWPSQAVPVLGFPALAVPTGIADGLPTGVRSIGGRSREDLLLDAAVAIEARTPRVRPVVLRP